MKYHTSVQLPYLIQQIFPLNFPLLYANYCEDPTLPQLKIVARMGNIFSKCQELNYRRNH